MKIQILAAILAMSTASISSGGQTASGTGVVGVYTGTSTCPDRGTRLTVTITERANGLLTGMIRFFPKELPKGAGTDSFVLRVQGPYNAAGETRLRPMRFESRPPTGMTFGAKALVGRFDSMAGTFSGTMTGEGCTFSVTRDPDAEAQASAKAARKPASPSPESRPAAPTAAPAPSAAPQPKAPTSSAMVTSAFAKDTRLNAVPPDMRELVVADADKAQPYCEATPALSAFLDCGCVGQSVFDHRIETADYGLRPPTSNDIRQNRTPPPELAATYTRFFARQEFMNRLKACMVPQKVEAYGRAYVAKMESLTPAARECAVADFLRAFSKAPAPQMSVAQKMLSNAMASCNVKHR